MNPDAHDQEQIVSSAAEWWVEQDEGLSAARAREFQAWLARDPRHAAAFAQLESTRAVLRELPLVRPELQPVIPFPAGRTLPRPARRGRFRPRWLTVGIAAGAVLAALGWWQWRATRVETGGYATTSGGYERVVLADGSVVELNAATEVKVEFSRAERRITLRGGEANFTVAHDTARPFVVSAGHVSVRAVGTAFDVRLAAAGVEVLVTEGTVRLAPAGAAVSSHLLPIPGGGGPTLLMANERLVIPRPAASGDGPGLAPPVVEKVSQEMIRAALAWQERRLTFANTPLADVVGQFNRRNRLQLTIGDPTLANVPIGGTFAADHPEGFLRLLEEAGILKVERRSETDFVLHDAR